MMDDVERYMTADAHYDLEQAETIDNLRVLFRRFVGRILHGELQEFKVNAPGRYGRLTGSFVFSGEAKTFTYILTVKLKRRSLDESA